MRRTALRFEGEGDNLIAYRGRVFRFTDANDEDDQTTARAAAEFLGLDKIIELDDMDAWSLREAVNEHKPEALVGHVDGDQLVMTSQSDYRHGRGSRLLRSLLRELGLSGAKLDDGGETSEEMPAGEVTGDLPDTLLHGTTSEHMPGILRKGLTADETRSNYELGREPDNAIQHSDTVFLTENPGKAEYHAVNAVHQLGVRRTPGRGDPYSTRRAEAGFPVIVEFAIPDRAKLVPDYDIDVWSESGEGSFEQTERQRRKRRDTGYEQPRTKEDPFKLSRKFGIFGYRGRIPASFIRSIMIFTGERESEGFQPKNWTTVTREQLERAIEFGEAGAWDWEDTCHGCGELEENCECERCEECGDKDQECMCKEDSAVAAYWRAFRIVADAPAAAEFQVNEDQIPDVEMDECEECYEEFPSDKLIEIEGRFGESWCLDCVKDGTKKCSNCDNRVKNDDAVEVDDAWYCEDCASEEFYSCDNCGKLVSDIESVGRGSEMICGDCLKKSSKHFKCPDCDKVFSSEYKMEGPDGETYCGDCFSESYYTCDGCGEAIHNEDARSANVGETLCEICFGENYGVCSGCGEAFDSGHLDDEGYCEDCGHGGPALHNNEAMDEHRDIKFEQEVDSGQSPLAERLLVVKRLMAPAAGISIRDLRKSRPMLMRSIEREADVNKLMDGTNLTAEKIDSFLEDHEHPIDGLRVSIGGWDDAQRLFDIDNIVFRLDMDATGALADAISSSYEREHPVIRDETVGWARIVPLEDGDVWFVEELQSDVNFHRDPSWTPWKPEVASIVNGWEEMLLSKIHSIARANGVKTVAVLSKEQLDKWQAWECAKCGRKAPKDKFVEKGSQLSVGSMVYFRREVRRNGEIVADRNTRGEIIKLDAEIVVKIHGPPNADLRGPGLRHNVRVGEEITWAKDDPGLDDDFRDVLYNDELPERECPKCKGIANEQKNSPGLGKTKSTSKKKRYYLSAPRSLGYKKEVVEWGGLKQTVWLRAASKARRVDRIASRVAFQIAFG